MPDAFIPTIPDDFERLIALLYQETGFEVMKRLSNTKGYDIEILLS
ncbi:hypothetical protein SAMN05421863_102350 [Nitrosomonas communis]|uniref:Uncharacterized protein n=1 Tax=Nitrosomonas communis TaxID=44574 RepID=A0A1I4PY28_9PROT|nr:hypothetical protein SAMN05421863_102350 [Nitrosomonas communis]